MSLFSLSKTLPKDDASSEDDDPKTGSGGTSEEGEPLMIPVSAHLSSAARTAVLSVAEASDFGWDRFASWSPAQVAVEFALHVEAWGVAVPEPEGLPDWTTAVASWPRGPLPRRTVESAKVEVKAAAVKKTEEPSPVAAPKPQAQQPPQPVIIAPPVASLPAVGEVPAALVPDLDLDSDIEWATLPVLPDLPAEAPSIQQTRQYKNYMKLRYEWQRRFPDRDLPKVVPGWYTNGKPSSSDPIVKENTEKASEKLKAAVAQLKAAKEGALPVTKVTHRMSMTTIGDKKNKKPDTLSRASAAAATTPTDGSKRDRALTAGTKSGKRLSMQFMKKKGDGDE